MPNAIQYNNLGGGTTSLRAQNMYLGVGDVGKGPTETTGFWNGITPPSGGYTIYMNKVSNGPSIYTVANNTELINLSNQIAGQTFATAADAISWFFFQDGKIVCNIDYETIITTGLNVIFDAGFTPSYPTTGTNWRSVNSNYVSPCILRNGPTYRSGAGYGYGCIEFDGTNDFCLNLGVPTSTASFTVSVWVYPNTTTNGTYSIIKGNGSVNSLGFVITDGAISITVGTSAGSQTVSAGSNTAAWVNYTITRDSNNTVTVYKNNSSIGSFTLAGNFAIGDFGKSSTSLYYKGLIGNVFSYNATSLTTNGLTQNYNALKGRYGL